MIDFYIKVMDQFVSEEGSEEEKDAWCNLKTHLQEWDEEEMRTELLKYRKKPIVVNAYQTDKEIEIKTLEGAMTANIGDWIITGIKGEQYPCKPDIFLETYEPINLYEHKKKEV